MIGAFGSLFFFWSMGMYVFELLIIPLGFFLPVTGLICIVVYNKWSWARSGQDLWLRINSSGVELAQVGFRTKQHTLAWSEIQNWLILIYSLKYRRFRLKTTSGAYLELNPLEYVWVAGNNEQTVAEASALADNIEALLKTYAGDRQGKTEEMSSF